MIGKLKQNFGVYMILKDIFISTVGLIVIFMIVL